MVLAHDISKGDRTKDVKITQNITFETMLLAPDTLKGLKKSGFYKPSPIQLQGIPIGKCGFDLLLEAKSGTGKTATFATIALEKIDTCKGLQVVILTPTREIAAQICDVLKQIGCMYKDLQVEVVMGGLPVKDDIEKFQKPVHIVVGSPGRLKNLIKNKNIDVKSVRLLVLDEADKLMENSFQRDIKYIHKCLPQQKQVIMSSATFPESSRQIINTYVQNVTHVRPDSDCILLGIEQKVSFVKYNSNIIRYTHDKFKELHKILGRLQFKQCLVFCNYQVRVAEVHDKLRKEDWPSEKLYGQQDQMDRLDALMTLQQYKCRILVATDLAARGIDASNIDLVVNFEPPQDWQTYLHRIGRAGRFGSYGLAVTILGEGKEEQNFSEMLKSISLPINMRNLWTNEEFNISDTALSRSAPSPHQLDVLLDKTTRNDQSEKVSYKDMWELLSSKSHATTSIETFETLCNLSENSDTSKIEQFSDLMLSLKNSSQETEEHVMFKTIEMGKLFTNLSLFSQNSIAEKDHVIKELKEGNADIVILDINYKNNKLNAKLANESQNINDDDNNIILDKNKTSSELNAKSSDDSQNINDDVNNIISDVNQTRNELNAKSCDEFQNINDNVNNFILDINKTSNELNTKSFDESQNISDDVNNSTMSKISKQQDTCDTMLNVDLPTTFSSLKFNTSNTKWNIVETMYQNNRYRKDVKINKDFSVIDKQSKSQEQTEIQAKESDINETDNEINDEVYIGKEIWHQNNTKVNNYKEETTNYYEEQFKSNNPQKHNFSQSHDSKVTSESEFGQKESPMLHYNDWYIHFKMRMKYIEQAVYIEEMSKF